MAIKPLGDRVLIEPIEQEEKVGSIYIPDTAKEKPSVGIVIEVGPGEGQGEDRTPLSVKKGDKVMYGKYSGTEIQDQGKDFLIVRESDIFAVVS